MFSTILRHPFIGYALLALVSLAFDEYWRRWERVQRARAELARRQWLPHTIRPGSWPIWWTATIRHPKRRSR